MLGDVIGRVFSSILPVQAKFILLDAAVHPVESHVRGLGEFPAHVSVEDAVGGQAVGLDWGGRLRVAHFDEGRADGNSLMDVEDNCSSFGLRGGSHDGVDGLKFGEYQSIWGGSGPDVERWWIVA